MRLISFLERRYVDTTCVRCALITQRIAHLRSREHANTTMTARIDVSDGSLECEIARFEENQGV